jgi:O-antigen/teichoic acid export membrane protein
MTPGPPQSADSQTVRADLDRRLASGLAWTVAARLGSQMVSYGSMLLLAHLLSPEDFGLLGMTALFLGYMTILTEFGIGSTIVVMTELTPSKIRQLHAVSVLIGFFGTLLSFFAGRAAAAFFRTPTLEVLVPVMGIGFAIAGFRVVPQSILSRDLRFRLISALEGMIVILQAVLTVFLAWAGMGYWSLVIGPLIGSAVTTLLFYYYSPCGLAKPVLADIWADLAFSRRVLVSRSAWYLYENADFAVAGRILGNAVLGIYTMAWSLANSPVDKGVTMILRVTGPVFSKVQHDAVELRRYLRLFTEGIALFAFPVGFGLALVAFPLVATVFDKRWADLAMPLRLLAIYAAIRCVYVPVFQVLNVTRDVRYGMYQSMVMLVVLPPAFWYGGSRWGAVGIAAAWVCLYPVLTTPVIFRILAKLGMPVRAYLGALRPAALASLAMAAVVLIVGRLMSGSGAPTELVVESLSGAFTYAAILYFFFRPRVNAFVDFARAFRRG